MAKYIVKHTSIMHNETVYGEGSEIELDKNQAERLADFLTPAEKAAAKEPKGEGDKTPKAETKGSKAPAKKAAKPATKGAKTAQPKVEPEKEDEAGKENGETNDPDKVSTDGGAE